MEYLAVQLFNGLVNGSFYALLSLGLAVIFGMMRIVNFAHGAFYMLGAFVAYVLLQQAGIGFCLAVSVAVWFVIERTRLGMVVRAATERAELTRALGVDVDRWITPMFGFGLGLAAIAGVLAAPMRNVSPLMGSELIILTFAVVVIGGMGSIKGAIAAGFLVGVLSSVGAIFDPAIEGIVAFALMAVLLLVRPSGLFGSLETS